MPVNIKSIQSDLLRAINTGGRQNVSLVPSDISSDADIPLVDIPIQLDSTRVDWEREENLVESDNDAELKEDLWEDIDLVGNLVDMAHELDNGDDEWVPPELRKKDIPKKECPKEYVKGPTVKKGVYMDGHERADVVYY
ncbi:hypothetical protein BDQ17DRAFT_1429488 [Cyathus striatus]|nr:hypothetical protein BDQ17DRAFT_1429488 [Cyathus striatus]